MTVNIELLCTNYFSCSQTYMLPSSSKQMALRSLTRPLIWYRCVWTRQVKYKSFRSWNQPLWDTGSEQCLLPIVYNFNVQFMKPSWECSGLRSIKIVLTVFVVALFRGFLFWNFCSCWSFAFWNCRFVLSIGRGVGRRHLVFQEDDSVRLWCVVLPTDSVRVSWGGLFFCFVF